MQIRLSKLIATRRHVADGNLSLLLVRNYEAQKSLGRYEK